MVTGTIFKSPVLSYCSGSDVSKSKMITVQCRPDSENLQFFLDIAADTIYICPNSALSSCLGSINTHNSLITVIEWSPGSKSLQPFWGMASHAIFCISEMPKIYNIPEMLYALNIYKNQHSLTISLLDYTFSVEPLCMAIQCLYTLDRMTLSNVFINYTLLWWYLYAFLKRQIKNAVYRAYIMALQHFIYAHDFTIRIRATSIYSTAYQTFDLYQIGLSNSFNASYTENIPFVKVQPQIGGGPKTIPSKKKWTAEDLLETSLLL
jgi:hypothetical protein